MLWTDEMIARLLALRDKKIGPKLTAWLMELPENDVKYQLRRMKLQPLRSPFPRISRDHRAERLRKLELAEARKAALRL
jgi:hypothetical protein